ncbi:MAG: hypothetical protein GY777_14605 [Candidatus Brocadiaceae bacterium]|nr:hypothetical protein [Candidatus Brocadiaceae bacterium]
MIKAYKVLLFLLATSFIFAGNTIAQLPPADHQDVAVKTTKKETLPSVSKEKIPTKKLKSDDSKELPIVSTDTLPISYNAKDSGTAGLKQVELYYTIDEGKTWEFYGIDSDLKSPFEFKVKKDGLYGFFTVATDKAGNIEPNPAPGTLPHVSVIVDSKGPQVKVIAPNGGDIFNITDKQQIRWSASDENLDPNPITLQYSIDGGKNWRDIQSKIPNTGEYQWTPPKESTLDCRVQVVAIDRADNRTVDASPGFIIDGIAPKTQLSSAVVIPPKDIEVKFEASDEGGSGMLGVELWYRIKGDKWTKQGSYSDIKAPIKFAAPGEGNVDLCLVGFDKAGNREISPEKRTDAASSYKSTAIDFTPPKVTLYKFPGKKSVQGGSSQTLSWEASDSKLTTKPISLSFSLDNGSTWKDIAKGVANTGSLTWEIPNTDSDSALVRISAIDEAGNEGIAQCENTFAIDSTAPESHAFFSTKPISASSKTPISVVKATAKNLETKTPKHEELK